jgi:cytochrome c peroxidase
MHLRASSILLVLILFSASCKKDTAEKPLPNLLDKPIRPEHFPAAYYNFGNNTYSKKGFELGRKLFFDPILSVDSTISCASCHHQKDAFADGGKAFSMGINNQTSSRNSPPVFNMAWNRSFMWDGGINHIEIMPFAPIINPKEMGEDLNDVIEKLKNHSEYPGLFYNVFKQTSLSDQQMFWALAQYMANLVSANSRYDQYLKGKISFTEEEELGLLVFRQHCAACHQEPLFTDYLFHNNGIDALFNDKGRFTITQNPNDLGKFKTPTLRNIALTEPYMHDGRFADLEAVIHHYNTNIKPSYTLSPLLNHSSGGIPMNNNEKQALIAFLKTLTDDDFISNHELSE